MHNIKTCALIRKWQLHYKTVIFLIGLKLLIITSTTLSPKIVTYLTTNASHVWMSYYKTHHYLTSWLPSSKSGNKPYFSGKQVLIFNAWFSWWIVFISWSSSLGWLLVKSLDILKVSTYPKILINLPRNPQNSSLRKYSSFVAYFCTVQKMTFTIKFSASFLLHCIHHALTHPPYHFLSL